MMKPKNQLTTEFEVVPQQQRVTTVNRSLALESSLKKQEPMIAGKQTALIASKPNDMVLSKGGKGTSSTPNLQSTAGKRNKQSFIEAKNYLSTIQGAQANFIQKNIEQVAGKSESGSKQEFQALLDFVDKTRKRMEDY